MPVEIRELVIRAITIPESEADEIKPETTQTPADQEAIVQECVRQVLHILKKQEER